MSAISSTFRSGEPALRDLLDEIAKGHIQLPDFQRGWVWDDEHIRSLIASLSLSYPIGAVLLLETGGEGVRFKPRLVEGVKLPSAPPPQRLLLDGQQRMTSLFLSLRSGQPVLTTTEKGKAIERVYYLDMAKALDPLGERIDAVVSLPPERILTSNFARTVDLDISTPEREWAAGLFPLDALFDLAKYSAWRRGYTKLHRDRDDDARLDLFDLFEANVISRFQHYRVPTIELLRDTPKEAVCQVFEKVNMGGVALTVFELVTATFAADEFSLRDDWEARAERLHAHEVLSEVSNSDFLAAVTLLASYQESRVRKAGVGCKRRDILQLSVGAYRAHADAVERGLKAASKLLMREKVFSARNLPYQTQLIPLAAICAALGDRFETDGVKAKLARWYWCGVFGELYSGASETRFAFDIVEVLAWVDGGDEPRTVREAAFFPTRLLSMQTRLSAAYKGLMAKLMQEGSWDFKSGDAIELTNFFEEAVDIHHIFPRAYCEKQGLDRNLWNSVVNKGPLTARTNRIIGGHAPSTYLSSLERNHHVAPARLDAILESHLVNPALLRADDFGGFIRTRAAALLDLIEDAMGKPVSGRETADVVKAYGGVLTRAGVA
ncbi:DUF262 domain-containing protein [Aggregicoccus sp. 17bor-14]|uniref:DUF262 domain-containing protein n=1 Tax=Myxococcaceae TaxID=31 RepID=UPI00129CFF67|nr:MULTISPECIES: DUF262 domain-containing protein [Myxococcaceae]MBF5043177.1 DUF262 domain-containing protein [Simulacricoccus sp. 17bor-14]MRI88935.1 DUF262 domain-containing protein [Aggregicoccus sp. 17bor-14]